jgi:hypothetical protein
MPRTPILKAALLLHEMGLWVVPCDGKKAVVKGWPTKRLTEEELREYLSSGTLNIAVALHRSEWIDIECDSNEAAAKLRKLFGGKIPRTPTFKSKRGKHRLFLRPPGLPKKAVIKIDGIEFRIGNGKGVLSVFPPSVHEEGVRYKWIKGLRLFDDLMPAELPQEIVELLQGSAGPASSNGTSENEITEGKRNSELFKLGCRLRESGLDARSIESALLSENAIRCKPPLSEEEVKSISESAAKAKAGSFSDEMVLWHTPDGTAYATVKFADHFEHWPVYSKPFAMFVRRHIYETTGDSVTRHYLDEIAAGAEAEAVFKGDCHDIHLRTAELDGRLYLDLGNSLWQAVEIDAGGWQVLDNPPVRFCRNPAMEALPLPVSGGTIDELRQFVNVCVEDMPLVLAWLAHAFRPSGPYAILKIRGEQGSAKSTTIRVLRSLIDPNKAPARSKPPGEHDLAIAVSKSWVYCLDNLSYLDGEISDALCRLATTGAGFATRKLYTDDTEMIFNAVRPVILAGIGDVGTRSDLLDRCVSIELPTISEDKRQDEKKIWADFEEAQPRILGALLDVVSAGIRNLPEVQLSRLPRMADFLRWATAVEEALGFESGTCERAYELNRAEAHATVLEESPVASTLIRFMQKRNGESFEGTAAELLRELRAVAGIDPEMTRQKSWPKNARALSVALSRFAPNLRFAGVFIERGVRKSGRDKRRTIIVRAGKNLPPMSDEDRRFQRLCKTTHKLGKKPRSPKKKSRKRGN